MTVNIPSVVALDSMICIWGIKKVATKGQESNIKRAEGLIEALSKDDTRILIAAPIVTELLCPIDSKDRAKFIAVLHKRFRIAPLDTLAAVKAGELWHSRKDSWRELYEGQPEEGLKARFKYDLLIAAIAVTNSVKCLYTEDSPLTKLCDGLVTTNPIPLTTTQLTIGGGE